MKKNILFVDHHAELGGGEIALLEIIKNLDRDKFSLLAILGNEGLFVGELKRYNVEVIIDKLPAYFRNLDRDPEAKNSFLVFVKSVFCLPAYIKKIRRVIAEKEIDILYINSVKSLLYAAYAAKGKDRKIIWHLHDCLSVDFYPLWMIKIIILFSKMADCIICVSSTVKDYFVKAGGDEDKTAVIYNGVDIRKFHPDIIAEDLKNKFGFSGKKIVSIIGRLEPWKGQKVFIETAKKICSNRDDIIFLVVGGALFGFNKYEAELKDMVNNLKLDQRVFFLGFRDDIENIYAISDIIVHCSLRPEPFGRDIIEAFACGKPVISTNLGAATEIINNDTGILIPPYNIGQLAKNIILLLDKIDLRKKLSMNARKLAENNFSIVRIVNDIEKKL